VTTLWHTGTILPVGMAILWRTGAILPHGRLGLTTAPLPRPPSCLRVARGLTEPFRRPTRSGLAGVRLRLWISARCLTGVSR
jgi:hypothetical protein